MLSQGLQMGLLIGCVLVLLGSVRAWYRQRMPCAIGLLMVAALLLRLLMAGLDPFLHDWDERFHAVVAKNMMLHPLAPMLHPGLLPYDYKAWCCNYIWLHKQPLFMWQMALSMKLLGVNEVAMRLPSALLGSLVLYPVYRLGRLLLDADTGYVAALLASFAFYQLEQTSGVIGMDHNDVAFAAYVTASIWAYYEYCSSARPWRWLLLVGVFAGAAVLCKWLVGLVVYAGWGVAILQTTPRRWAEYGRLLASVVVALAVAMPWQLYSAWRFPLESAYERAYNTRHFLEPLEGHDYPWYYHFGMLPTHYGALLALMVLGLVLLWRRGQLGRLLPMLAMVAVVYAFFTVAATRMYSYTYVVSALLLLLAAVPLADALRGLRTAGGRRGSLGVAAVVALVLAADARPWTIVRYHFAEAIGVISGAPLERAVRLANANLYRHLDAEVPPHYIIFNAQGSDELQAQFYSTHPVYGWWPAEAELNRLLAQGWRVAYFPAHHDQHPPDYLTHSPGAIPLWGSPQ